MSEFDVETEDTQGAPVKDTSLTDNIAAGIVFGVGVSVAKTALDMLASIFEDDDGL